ncbi:MAG: thermonuclease family protein [Candidatus Omnitrophica bacterium]|nr:thermonuclease family protein [Candidatus Omnitrophota bacterium]
MKHIDTSRGLDYKTLMPGALKASEYQTLLEQIDAIYTRAQKESSRALNLIVTRAYWEIGKRIVTVEQKNNLRAQYGEALLAQISQHLTQKYGDGFSATNLRYMRRFYIAYPIQQAPAELDWTRYQVLSTIEDKQERQAYERKTIKEDWSSRDLVEHLRADGIKRVFFNGHRRQLSPDTNHLSPKLNVTRGTLYSYKLAQALIPADQGEVFVDCGFSMWRPARVSSPAALKSPVVETVPAGGGFDITASRRTPKDLYVYKALVVKVIDGDTLRAEIDLGLKAVTRQKLRLRGIDCPELNTAKGREAKAFVEAALQPCDFIIVKSYWSDLHGRYLADIFFSPAEQDPAKVTAEGEYLNQRLLDEGLAVRYEG